LGLAEDVARRAAPFVIMTIFTVSTTPAEGNPEGHGFSGPPVVPASQANTSVSDEAHIQFWNELE